MTTFEQLELNAPMLKAIEEMGFVESTPVQAETIPLTRSGRDILAQSRTGTGKTMAFAIPAVELIEPAEKVQVLILSPTRELAQQCGDEIRKLTAYMPYVHTANIYGGADYRNQFRDLRKANMVIGTPGRIMDHMQKGSLKLDNVKMVILDEADEMLNMGFKEDIETILQDVPEQRQIVLFSATIPRGILDITKQFQKDPLQINLVKDKATLNEIKQLYIDVDKHYKLDSLKLLLHYYSPKRAIIFTNTKSMVDELTELICEAGFFAQGIHGDMKQQQRSNVMAGFKSGKIEILVATDVAARGIDVNNVDYVFNYDLPRISEYYVHRIGRTGRAGQSGIAISLCCGRKQVVYINDLAHKLQSKIKLVPVPTIAAIKSNEVARNLDTIKAKLGDEIKAENLQMIEKLIDQSYSAEQIAAALIDLAFVHDLKGLKDVPQFKKPEEKSKRLSDKKEFSGDLSQFNMVLNIGAKSRCKPNHIVGAITERTGIAGKFIGKIIIEENRSLVAIPQEFLADILIAMANIKICGKPVEASAFSGSAVDSKKRFKGRKPQANAAKGGGKAPNAKAGSKFKDKAKDKAKDKDKAKTKDKLKPRSKKPRGKNNAEQNF